MFLVAGQKEAGLYVRLDTGTLARLSPDRLDWSTLELLLEDAVLAVGDEVLFEAGGRRRTGRLVEPVDDRLVIKGSGGEHFSVPLSQVTISTFRLLFPPSDLRVGDEFIVRSLSGREYRGVARSVHADRIGVELQGAKEEVVMRVQQLDLKSIKVLVPVPLSLLGCSPVA